MLGRGVVSSEAVLDLFLDDVPRTAAARDCRCDQGGRVIGTQAGWRGRGHAGEGPLCPPIAEETDRDLIALKVQQLLGSQPW